MRASGVRREGATNVCRGAVSVEAPSDVVAHLGRRRGGGQPYGHGDVQGLSTLVDGCLALRWLDAAGVLNERRWPDSPLQNMLQHPV